jgi:hypothetical protein
MVEEVGGHYKVTRISSFCQPTLLLWKLGTAQGPLKPAAYLSCMGMHLASRPLVSLCHSPAPMLVVLFKMAIITQMP